MICIFEINPSVAEAVKANDGYCPCLIERNADTKCMCKDFRDMESGTCHCGRFVKLTDKEVTAIVRRNIARVPEKESLADRNCPVCGAGINWDALNDPLEYAPDFCTACGQRFDWGEEEARSCRA